MKKKWLLISFFLMMVTLLNAQLPAVFSKERTIEADSTPTVCRYLSPVKILWKTPNADTNIINEKRLLLKENGQAELSNINT